jgi:hypothetical protein
MQTFLPFPDFEESAFHIDPRRLGKQRVENLQIMKALVTGGKGSWVNHPATKMWRGHEFSLLMYQKAVCDEWVHNLNFSDNCLTRTAHLYFSHADLSPLSDHSDPPWLGDKAFHLAHQSNLVRKDPEYYRKYFPDVPDNLPYIWPTN